MRASWESDSCKSEIRLTRSLSTGVRLHSPGEISSRMQWRRELICCVMIGPMPSRRFISLDNKILDLHAAGIPRFGQQSARQLALALAEVSPGKDSNTVTISDLLDYLPARYED